MKATNSADGVLGDIVAEGATAAHNIANFLLDGCKLNRAEVDLQALANLENGAKPLYAPTSGPVSRGCAVNAGVATTPSRRLHKEDADQINKEGR